MEVRKAVAGFLAAKIATGTRSIVERSNPKSVSYESIEQ
jgi:hypothetical protein